jgi:preprotein translocase subunit YajC
MPTQIASALPVLQALVFAKAKTTNGSILPLFIFILVIGGIFLFIRPQRKRQREMMAQQRAVSVGDEVVTSAGIVGRVKSMTEDRVLIEIAPGSTMEIVRRAIGQVIVQPETPAWGGSTGGQWNFPASTDNPDDTGNSPKDGTGGPA